MTVKLPISFKRLAALLSIAILLVSLPFSAVAIKNVDVSRTERCEDDQIVIDPVLPDDEIESELLSDALSKKPGDKTLSELQKMAVDTLSLPEVIDSETAIRKGHVNRIAQQEQLFELMEIKVQLKLQMKISMLL